MQKLALIGISFLLILVGTAMVSCKGLSTEPELDKIPVKYQEKHMPEGWWADPTVIAQGKRVYEGLENPESACVSCHGRDGTPKQRKVRDLRDAVYANKMTDSYMFWRVSEGVPKTLMDPWKDKLTEEQISQVIAYLHTFSHGGKAEAHIHAQEGPGGSQKASGG